MGLVVLLAVQIMLMEASHFAVMCIARVVQGVSSSVIWVVGLALLCDTVPEKNVGRQLGWAEVGILLGFVVGPPVGGLLYEHIGYRAPFIFSVIWAMVDLVGRLLVIERKDAAKWGYDPSIVHGKDGLEETTPAVVRNMIPNTSALIAGSIPNLPTPSPAEQKPVPLSLVAVCVKLLHSPRALMALTLCTVYGAASTAQETAIPLHLQVVWGLRSGTMGLVILAGVFPTLVWQPLAGWYVDVNGTEWISVLALIGGLIWWGLMILKSSLALFIVTIVFATFFTSTILTPAAAELAAVSRGIQGVGYAHVYGALVIVYGTGNAVGSVMAGQLYSHASLGWPAICCMSMSFMGVCVPLSLAFTGDQPLLGRWRRWGKGRGVILLD